MQETWIPVTGYEGLYEVSDLGRIKNLSPSKRFPVSGHILSPRRAGAGYRKVTLYKDGTRSDHYVHSVVMVAFVSSCPDGHNINHKDGDKRNNAVSNLEYVTYSENNTHSYRTGLKQPINTTGQANGNAKLVESQVIEIARRLQANERASDIARDLNVPVCPVYDIKAQRKWRHLFAQGGPLEDLAAHR